jgi:hypothetical protein
MSLDWKHNTKVLDRIYVALQAMDKNIERVKAIAEKGIVKKS